MTEDKKQNLADLARKKRYLHLVEKLHSGTPLSKQEITELEVFESDPLDDAIVKTIEEVSKIMEVSLRTVYRWKRDGMPVTQEGYYDLDEIKRWYDGRSVIDDEELEGKIYWETKLRKYKATLLELELKKVKGDLLDRGEVEKGRIERIIAVKQAFLALPSRLAPVLAMKKPRGVEGLLYEAISEIIDEYAGVKHVINDKEKSGSMDKGRKKSVEKTRENKRK